MNNIKIDFLTNTITVGRSFYNEAQIFGTSAYAELTEVKRIHPDMRIAVRTSKSRGTSPFKGVTYRYMRAFIALFDSANLPTFERVILTYQTLYDNDGVVYKEVRGWFLENYPNHRDMCVEAVPHRSNSKIICIPDKTDSVSA